MERLLRWTSVIAILFAASSMAVIFYMSAHKVVVIADEAQTSVSSSEQLSTDQQIGIAAKNTETGILYIPIESEVKATSIAIQSIEVYRGLRIELDGASTEFYKSQEISGNVDALQNAFYIKYGGKLYIYLSFEDIYECTSHVTGNTLQITMARPSEQYDAVVVIDDRTTAGEQAGQVAHAIATKVKEQLSESGVQVFTIATDEVIEDSDVLFLTTHAPANLYLRLSFAEAEDASILGMSATYNAAFFMPWYDNATLADQLLRSTVTAVNGKANGIGDCGEESLLKQVSIPGCDLCLGYLSNAQEAKLLQQDNYQTVIATAIASTITQELATLQE
ncbi:MAG: N-acetylmuramoyl-L-alanine amidase [Lachnospiraceae bacterium]|nr:N-acetylmuramoyl-L-alanine amidase [Lachnospiraceae bacterium]